MAGFVERTFRPSHTAVRGALLLITAVVTVACNKDSTSSPTTPTPTTTVAAASITEDFTGTVAVGGSAFYSFSVGENGTVNVTFSAASGNGVPSTIWLGLGIGTPSGEDCTTASTVNTPPTSTAQITGTYRPGIYCVKVSDIGNLFAPASFTVTIAHP